MLLVTTEFSYLFLDIHLQNVFSAFGVQFISSLRWHREQDLYCAAQRGVSSISGAPSSTSVQSRAFQAQHTQRKTFFFTNPASSDPNCGGIYIYTYICQY